MDEDELDETIILPEEVYLSNESEDDEYLFNFDPTVAKKEREEINHDIWELHSQRLY